MCGYFLLTSGQEINEMDAIDRALSAEGVKSALEGNSNDEIYVMCNSIYYAFPRDVEESGGIKNLKKELGSQGMHPNKIVVVEKESDFIVENFMIGDKSYTVYLGQVSNRLESGDLLCAIPSGVECTVDFIGTKVYSDGKNNILSIC